MKDQAGKAVFHSNANGRVDEHDSYVIAENQAPMSFDSLRAHAGNLGLASSREIAESVTAHE